MKEQNDSTLPATSDRDNAFKGYTLDQLRYQLVYTSLQKEVTKAKLFSTLNKAIDATPFGHKGKRQTGSWLSSSIFSKMTKGLGYADYIIMGYSAFKTVRNLTGIFRRRK